MRMSDWSSDVCSSDLFDMEDLRSQLRQMRNMGGIGALASMIPGLAKAKAAMANNGPDDRLLLRMEAMVGSMTPKERAKPDILNAKQLGRASCRERECQDVQISVVAAYLKHKTNRK